MARRRNDYRPRSRQARKRHSAIRQAFCDQGTASVMEIAKLAGASERQVKAFVGRYPYVRPAGDGTERWFYFGPSQPSAPPIGGARSVEA